MKHQETLSREVEKELIDELMSQADFQDFNFNERKIAAELLALPMYMLFDCEVHPIARCYKVCPTTVRRVRDKLLILLCQNQLGKET